MIIATFGTDSYGAQLSLKCDLVDKSFSFVLLTMVNNKETIKEFTDFAKAVDAYNAFEAGTFRTEYGIKLKEAYFSKCKEYVNEHPEKYPHLDTTKPFTLCGFDFLVENLQDLAGFYSYGIGFEVGPEVLLPDFFRKAEKHPDYPCFETGDYVREISFTYKELVGELERCFIEVSCNG